MAKKKASTVSKVRRSHNARLIIMLVLALILAIMYFTMEKFRIWILGILIFLLAAIGMEMSGTDYDLGKAWEDKSFSNAKVEMTEEGTWLTAECEKRANFNCDNFAHQGEAQALFEACGGVDNDIHGLDGDNDGIVCEALRKEKEEDEKRTIRSILGLEAETEVSEEGLEAETEIEGEAESSLLDGVTGELNAEGAVTAQ